MSIPSLQLLDGTSIPWLAWGSGTAVRGSEEAIEKGVVALKSGINHIDTAQVYKTEAETAESIKLASANKSQVYVTSKLSWDAEDVPVPLSSVRAKVESSLEKLGFIPDLFLIHNPHIAAPGDLKGMWKIFEDLKDEGKLKSIGVSNFRPQDLEAVLANAKYKPVVNQLEYHPYVLAHLEPVLALQKEHGIVTESYGGLTPLVRHPTGGPLKPVLEKIATRISQEIGKEVNPAAVLLLWMRAQGVVAVSASRTSERIQWLGELAKYPQLLNDSDISEITRIGKTIHFRHYTEHMERDFSLPTLPSQ